MVLDPVILRAILRESKSPTTQVEVGGNSTVAKVAIAGDVFAVKDYSHRFDGFLRQQREWQALTFLDYACPGLAPAPLWCFQDEPVAIHSWISGSKPELGAETVGAMTKILETLKRAHGPLMQSHAIPHAVDSVCDVTDLSEQVLGRIIALGTAQNPDLQKILGHVKSQLGNLNRTRQVASKDRKPRLTLSPSDFGPHNMIHELQKSKFSIIDLEFFGVDDVHKLIGDTVLHPQISWSDFLLKQFLDEVGEIFDFSWERFGELLPFLSLKWAVIVLGRIARLGVSRQNDVSGRDWAELAMFYSELAEPGHADLILSRIVRT